MEVTVNAIKPFSKIINAKVGALRQMTQKKLLQFFGNL
jgi:hypothetical protein